MTDRRPFRSLLFVPGTRADRFARAAGSGADAVVLDLEDAVDAGRKADARRAVGEWLAAASPASPATTLVRVNAPDSSWLAEDLAWLGTLGTTAARIDALVLPKCERAAALERVADAVLSRRVVPLLETARGILNAVDILAANADVPAVLFGAEDLTAELGIPRTLDGEELLYARSRVVLAAATVGADPIDAIWVDLASPDALRKDAMRARALGFAGKMAIHPDQVAVINDVFSPGADDIAAARRIVDADDRARAAGDGVVRLDDRMVDAPVVKRARRLLALAELLKTRRP